MSLKTVTPSTLTGIKRLAKHYTASNSELTHSNALNLAANDAGFNNFRHAQNVLKSRPVINNGYDTYITVYWNDKETEQSGRETLVISLKSPWGKLVSKKEFKLIRELRLFEPEGPDHLCGRLISTSQKRAQESVCKVARTLQFINATGLHPSRGYSKAYSIKGERRVPGQDHVGIWFDDQKRYLLTDEPYESGLYGYYSEKRLAWLTANNYEEVKPNWRGMYNPDGGTRLFLLTHKTKGVPLKPLLNALEQLSASPSSSNWKGESAPRFPYFLSPGRLAENEAISLESRVKSKNQTATKQLATLGYIQTFVGARRRPNGKMPIQIHEKVGLLLKEILVKCRYRKGVYNRVNSVRCELDEWVMREYDSFALPNERFFKLYYEEENADLASKLDLKTSKQCIENLNRSIALLLAHYPDCAPLRRLIKFLEASEKSLLAWIASEEKN